MSEADYHAERYLSGDYDPPEPIGDDAMLDMSHEALDNPEPAAVEPPTDPWLVRRRHAFGASEMGALFIALGMRHAEDFPDFVSREAKPIRWRKRGVPRIFLRKAGLRRPLKTTEAMLLGTEREPMLIEQWTHGLRRGMWGKLARTLLPDTVQHSSVVPRQFYPLTHHAWKRLAVTPDAWAEDVIGQLVVIEAKCSYKPYMDKYRQAAPHHFLQLHAQMATMEADAGIAVEGERWSNDYWDRSGEPVGPIRTWPVRRDETVIDEIGRAVSLGWERVEELQHEERA